MRSKICHVCRKPRGFTLIELLVVVAIIAILVAILVPSLAKARTQSKNLVCMSNLRQIGIGMTMYSSENNDWIPYAVINEGAANQQSWDQALSPYVQSAVTITNGGYGSMTTTHLAQNIFKCPTDDIRRLYQGETRSYTRIRFSQQVGGTWTYEGFTLPIKRNLVATPCDTFLILEWQRIDNIVGNNWCSWATYSYFIDQGYGFGNYHNTGSNFLFFDGHAESMTKIEASSFDKHWRKN